MLVELLFSIIGDIANVAMDKASEKSSTFDSIRNATEKQLARNKKQIEQKKKEIEQNIKNQGGKNNG